LSADQDRPSASESFQRDLRRSVRRAGFVWATLINRVLLSRAGPQLRLPDFLCIGAQKAGTTWLYENLKRHPEVYLPERKEIHYWDWQTHRSLLYYSRFFRPAGPRLTGDFTPSYSLLPTANVERIRRLLPGLRILYLLRHPVERAWSHAMMSLVKVPKRPFEEVTEAELLAHFRSEDSRRRGAYRETIERWEARFPGRVLVGFYYRLTEDPECLLRSVCEHLGLSRPDLLEDYPLRQRIHAGPRVPLPERYREILAGMYAGEIEAVAERFPEARRWREHEVAGSCASDLPEATLPSDNSGDGRTRSDLTASPSCRRTP
jgi:hypothetical protein